jgi:hypothetical protein
MPGARRARSRVRSVESTRVSHHGHTGITRHSPRNGFTAYSALSLVTGLSCHHRRRKLVFANLTPASGRQDHTTSPSALAPFVKSAAASTASRLTFVTIAKRPFVGAGQNRNIPASTQPSSQISEIQKLSCRHRRGIAVQRCHRNSSSRQRGRPFVCT